VVSVDLFAGDIFRDDIRRGTAEKFIDAPAGRMAVGMVFDHRHHLLFVAGGFTAQAYVYDTRSGDTVRSDQFAANSVINDVTLTGSGAWFTDSSKPVLYFVPVSKTGELGTFAGTPYRSLVRRSARSSTLRSRCCSDEYQDGTGMAGHRSLSDRSQPA
jgi:hypothetical protein